MPKPEAILKNETHKTLWDFEIQSDHRIPTRRADIQIVNKRESERERGRERDLPNRSLVSSIPF